LLTDAFDRADLGYVSLVQPTQAAEALQQVFGDLDLVLPADNGGQQFGSVACVGVLSDAIRGLLTQWQQLEFGKIIRGLDLKEWCVHMDKPLSNLIKSYS